MKFFKTTTLLLLAAIVANTTNAQSQAKTKKEKNLRSSHQSAASHTRLANFYTFSYSTGTYAPLMGTTSLNNGQTWDDPADVIPIGFPFTLFNLAIDSLDFNAGLGGSLANTNFDFYIEPMVFDIIDRGYNGSTSLSPISYKVDGVTGSRIFKLEWQNVGFFDDYDSINAFTDYISFQLWLYEGTNDIEFHFGPSSINNIYNIYAVTGLAMGLDDLSYTDVYFLDSLATSPTMRTTADPNNGYYFLTGTPPSGIIYKFTHNGASIGINENNNIYNVSLYPNPTIGFTKIKISGNKAENTDIIITDILGKEIKKYEKIENNEVIINCEEFSNGIYFYQLKQDNTILSTGKFIKE